MANLTAKLLLNALAGVKDAEMKLREEYMTRNLQSLTDYKVDDLRDMVTELWTGEAKPIVAMTVQEIIDDILSTGCENCGEEVKLSIYHTKKSVYDGSDGTLVCSKCRQ